MLYLRFRRNIMVLPLLGKLFRWCLCMSDYQWYVKYYHFFIFSLIAAIFLILSLLVLVFYQIHHRPLPVFKAVAANGQEMTLISSSEPNLLPNTLIQWASKAAVAAYTFDFVHYNKQAALARPYFTDAGWGSY